MSRKNDQNFIACCDDLKAYVLENRYWPDRHTRLLNNIKFCWRTREVETEDVPRHSGMRDMDGHIGGRKKKEQEDQ